MPRPRIWCTDNCSFKGITREENAEALALRAPRRRCDVQRPVGRSNHNTVCIARAYIISRDLQSEK